MLVIKMPIMKVYRVDEPSHWIFTVGVSVVDGLLDDWEGL